jgi:flagellar biosynthesis protein FlhB
VHTVNPSELVFGVLLVLAILFVACYFGWRQISMRHALGKDRTLSLAERTFMIRQSRRRLICSVLMVLFAGFLVGWYFIEANLPNLKDALDQDPEKRQPLVELLTYYWIIALSVLFAILVLAGLDFLATARYARHQKRILDDERSAAVEIEASRLRKHRNGS